jgi:ribokinase
VQKSLGTLAGELGQSPESASVCAEALYRHMQGATTLVVTLGAKGALLRDAEGSRVFPALNVDVVDTTGAGDAFCGAYAAVLAASRDSVQAAICANAAAGLACTALGAQTALPTADQVRSRLST